MPIEGQNLSALLVQGYIPLNIGAARLFTSSNDVGALSTATAPALTLISTGALSSANPTGLVVSSAGAVATFLWAGVATPPDWSTQDGMTVHLNVLRATSSDTTKTYGVQIQAFDPTNGLTMSSGQTGALASSGVSHLTFALPAASTPSLNSAMTISVTTSTSQDKAVVGGAWVTYGRKRRG